MNSFVTLDQIAQVSLGYKSLQNDFFYLNRPTIETYGIEKSFLEPITIFRELEGTSYLQKPEVSTWLFHCKLGEGDLRGTGALRYIHAMSGRPAAQKKQSQTGRGKTIREVLQAQSGGLWYAPKAKPHACHLWLRKAFNTVYAPFVLETETTIDQRCNYIEPLEELSWELLGAVLTSTLFAYAVEINGSVSLGAGALEAPTSKLRGYPVFDARTLKEAEMRKAIRLVREVWEREEPFDWGGAEKSPGKHIRSLDEYFLERSGGSVPIEQIYNDLHSACKARITVAQDKVRTSKKQSTDSIASVAKGIADNLLKTLDAKRFPEDFCGKMGDEVSISAPRESVKHIELEAFFEQVEINVSDGTGKKVISGTYDQFVAEIIVRAVLLGREYFSVPTDRALARAALQSFLGWFDEIVARLDKALSESAIGTGYEAMVRIQVYQCMRIHPCVGERSLPLEINCTG